MEKFPKESNLIFAISALNAASYSNEVPDDEVF